MPDSHLYPVELKWTARLRGQLSSDGFAPLEVSAPREFSGEAGFWTPEHLLVAATASCLMTTFLAIAGISQLRVLSCHVAPRGKLEKVAGEGYRFTEILLEPVVSVAAADLERATGLLRKAEKLCFIRNSLRAAVRMEPQVVAAPAEAA